MPTPLAPMSVTMIATISGFAATLATRAWSIRSDAETTHLTTEQKITRIRAALADVDQLTHDLHDLLITLEIKG